MSCCPHLDDLSGLQSLPGPSCLLLCQIFYSSFLLFLFYSATFCFKEINSSDVLFFFPHQQTTVQEQSRIVQLERELGLRRAEIQELQAQLGRRAEDGHVFADGQPEEEHAAALRASRQEAETLKAVVEKQNLEISEMKLKVQQATKENVEMMESWKVLEHNPTWEPV